MLRHRFVTCVHQLIVILHNQQPTFQYELTSCTALHVQLCSVRYQKLQQFDFYPPMIVMWPPHPTVGACIARQPLTFDGAGT